MKSDSNKITINFDSNQNQCLNNSKYFLIIYSSTKKFSKLIIYPIEKRSILKIHIHDKEINSDKINNLKEILGHFDIIHTTGLLLEGNELTYECYLNLNSEELKQQNYEILSRMIEKIKKMFKFLKIQEINLDNNGDLFL
ncbi:MAG: hypothetical protein P8Y97_14260 [Candidatus Lokiarchaeota archaeon]